MTIISNKAKCKKCFREHDLYYLTSYTKGRVITELFYDHPTYAGKTEPIRAGYTPNLPIPTKTTKAYDKYKLLKDTPTLFNTETPSGG